MKTIHLVFFQFVVIFCLVLTIYMERKSTNVLKKSHFIQMEYYSAFIVDTPNCKIPNIDPFDKSIRKIVKKQTKLNCSDNRIFTYRTENVLFINWTAVRLSPFKNAFNYCQIQAIYRPAITNKSHNFYRYLKKRRFRKSIIVKDEFIRVKCFDKNGLNLYTNFHIFFQEKQNVEILCDQNFQRHVSHSHNYEYMNVLFVALDSMSRLNAIRYLKKTRKFLLQKLKAIDLQGYNKVADNTFVNIVPLSTGKFVEELPWNKSMQRQPFDKYEFIWNKYSKKGYRTLFAEDSPALSTFDYLKAGFHNAPADYFFRPYSLAMSSADLRYGKPKICLHGRTETHDILEYTLDFVSHFKKRPHFSYTFSTDLTHDSFKLSSMADNIFYKFFHQLYTSGTLDNTFVFFLSDHGLRFGRLRNTPIGMLEERLPMNFLIPPRWFKSKYPLEYKHMLNNAYRLSTPFDIYETLKDLLNFKTPFSRTRQSNRGISLFTEIPNNRTCEEAGISPHWCACYKNENIDVSNEIIVNIGNKLVDHLNKQLEEHKDVCEILKLQMIKSAFHLQFRNSTEKEKVTEYYADYRIVVQTKPGRGLFEGSVRYHYLTNSYDILDDISRLNSYGSSSKCISNSKLRKFCFCRSS